MNHVSLSLGLLRTANLSREREWWNEAGAAPAPSISFSSNELCGEVGEAANFCKKIDRARIGLRGGQDDQEIKDKLARELADVVICADLLAMREGINLEKWVALKFNETSTKQGLQTKFDLDDDGRTVVSFRGPKSRIE